MARRLRVEYPGAIYHVMSRGDHREPVFRDEVDRAPHPERGGTQTELWQNMSTPLSDTFLKPLGWDRVALMQHAKGDARKVRMARRVRAETSVTLKWIAAELHMGTWTHAANRLTHNPSPPDNQPDLNLCQK